MKTNDPLPTYVFEKLILKINIDLQDQFNLIQFKIFFFKVYYNTIQKYFDVVYYMVINLQQGWHCVWVSLVIFFD